MSESADIVVRLIRERRERVLREMAEWDPLNALNGAWRNVPPAYFGIQIEERPMDGSMLRVDEDKMNELRRARQDHHTPDRETPPLTRIVTEMRKEMHQAAGRLDDLRARMGVANQTLANGLHRVLPGVLHEQVGYGSPETAPERTSAGGAVSKGSSELDALLEAFSDLKMRIRWAEEALEPIEQNTSLI